MNIELASPVLLGGGVLVLYLIGFMVFHWDNERARDRVAKYVFYIICLVPATLFVIEEQHSYGILKTFGTFALIAYFSYLVGGSVNNLVILGRMDTYPNMERLSEACKWLEKISYHAIIWPILITILLFELNGVGILAFAIIMGYLYGKVGSLVVSYEMLEKLQWRRGKAKRNI